MEKSILLMGLRTAMVIGATLMILVIGYVVLPLIYPFLIGILLAILINPAVNWLEKKAKFPRWLAVLITILILLGLLITLITLLVIEIGTELNLLQRHLPYIFDEYMGKIQQFILYQVVPFYDRLISLYGSLDNEVQRNIEGYVQEVTTSLSHVLSEAGRSLINGILSFIRSIPIIATAFIISLLASFFLSKDWPKWQRLFQEVIPKKLQKKSLSVFQDLRGALFGFIRAQLTLISITFMIVLIGLMILRVDYALTIALFASLADLLPYVGPGLIFIPWIIYQFISGHYFMVIALAILYAIVTVTRQLLEPKILGDNVGLDPLTTLFALFVGFNLFGLIGLIVGPVLMVILQAFHRAGVFKELLAFIKG